MRVLIIEDEPAAAQRLESMLRRLEPDIRIEGPLDSVSASVQWFRDYAAPELIFLDIQLGDGLSFDIFSQVHVESFVVFTTAYDAYALKAFELNSLEYLLKPLQEDKLRHALEKFKKLEKRQSFAELERLVARMALHPKNYKQRFLVNVGDKIRSISVGQVAYFYSLDKGSFICTAEGMSYPLEQSLDSLEQQLDPAQFFRINRQYLISFQAINKLHSMPKSRIALTLHPPVADLQWVSAARTPDFRKWLDM